MTPRWTIFGIAMSGAVLAVPSPVPARQSISGNAAADPARGEHAKLWQLFKDSDERNLKLHPLTALQRGDLRYADRIGDIYADAEDAADQSNNALDLAALAAIDRSRLSPTDRLAFDVFRQQCEIDRRGYDPAFVRISRALPLDHLAGIQAWYPDVASGKGIAPFKTVADYENNLKRNAQYAQALDRAIQRMRDGIAAGITLPAVSVRNLLDEINELVADDPALSPFYGPVTMFPIDIGAKDRARLTAAYAAQIRDVLTPSHRRLRAFLTTEYLPHARATIGLAALPGGASYYRHLIETSTTLAGDPEQLHQLGLSQLARDHAELAAIKVKVGFAGTDGAFFDMLRNDKRFQLATPDAMRAAFADIARRIDTRVGEQFSLVPKTRITLLPMPAYSEKGGPPGSYSQGTPDGSRPGVFYYNTYDLPVRPTWLMEDLYLHEAVPGHHFQMSLAQENAALPAFMRFGDNAAYVEGWGLYAEGLGTELGMLTDPYQRVGVIYGDMMRAVRLVVDTGIHAKNWTRDQAIAFELANVPVSRTAATAEVDRYTVNAGQALAYKVGQLTLLRLRAKAKAELGDRYDPRRFHAAVLDSGALPLPVLEKKIDAWIAAGGG